jgi:hypothetical protein
MSSTVEPRERPSAYLRAPSAQCATQVDAPRGSFADASGVLGHLGDWRSA